MKKFFKKHYTIMRLRIDKIKFYNEIAKHLEVLDEFAKMNDHKLYSECAEEINKVYMKISMIDALIKAIKKGD